MGRVYIKDETGNELAVGIPLACQGVPGRDGVLVELTFRPFGNVIIGKQAKQGEFGFTAKDRTITADDFSGKNITIKEWAPGWVRVSRLVSR